jgi:hypothetical protein
MIVTFGHKKIITGGKRCVDFFSQKNHWLTFLTFTKKKKKKLFVVHEHSKNHRLHNPTIFSCHLEMGIKD